MIRVLLVNGGKTDFSAFSTGLALREGVVVDRADSGDAALSILSKARFDLAVLDETLADFSGMAFAGKLAKHHPLVNCALVSSLSPEAFHEAGEGLGLMAQLPLHPTGQDAQTLLERLLIIKGMNRNAKK